MKLDTIEKYTKIFTLAKEENLSLRAFCEKNSLNYKSITAVMHNIKVKEKIKENERKLIELYDSLVSYSSEKIDNDEKSEIEYIRDEEGKIKYYSFKIFRKYKQPITGKFTCEEMNTIYRLYSYYGDSLTQRTVSRFFVDYSLVDFKRILRAFEITKASGPFAPHMYEQYSEDELREIQLREKENSFLRKAEEDIIKNNEKLLKKYAQENIDLKNKLNNIPSLNVNFSGTIHSYELPELCSLNQGINLYISDVHMGAKVNSGSLYKENINYGFDEAKRRLSECLDKLSTFGDMDFINIVLLGDNIDCCGFDGLTARRDHVMPQNMDAREQAEKFIELMLWFTQAVSGMSGKIRIYSVPCGNHGGEYERLIIRSLFSIIKNINPEIETTLWEEFFGYFTVGSHTIICCHGKDAAFMKKGLPLNLNDKTKAMIYEYIDANNITGDNIHVIKGDLHSNNLDSCKKFDYRNVLSLFGASDYSNMNFTRNSYGLSYDLFICDNIIRGTFENLLGWLYILML